MNLLMEKHSIKPIGLPVDMNTAAITGARIGLAKGDRVAVCLHMGDSTAAVVQASFQQHTLLSGGSSKALSIDNCYFHKKAALDVFTKVEPGAKASSFDLSSVFSDDEGVVVFEIRGEDLDVDGGYAFISVDLADSTAAKLVSGIYILSDVRYSPAYNQAI